MFTGIVQGIGEITAIRPNGEHFRTHTLKLNTPLNQGLEIGASVAHNGCCLTVTRIDGDYIDFDLMSETLAKTNLGRLNIGDFVNIERAARFGDEIGGHVMSGHIMTTTHISRIDSDGPNRTLWFTLLPTLKPYIFSKGFIGLDGCSLTIGDVTDTEFNVHLIPETLNRTLFGQRQAGDEINIEIDAHTQAIVDTVHRIMHKHADKA